jgi:histidine triad (HIT) family protein
MASIFSKIIEGQIPSYKIAETEDFLAFLDVFPLMEGHVLVVPKKEVDNILDLSPELYTSLFSFTQKIGKAIEAAIPCKKVGIAVIGLEVPHAHIHLVPINSADDLNFTRPKLTLQKEKFEIIQQAIISKTN